MATSKVISSSKAMSSSSSKPKDSDPSASFSSQAARSHRFSSADHHRTVDGVLRSVYSAPPHPPSSESVLPNDHYLEPSKTADDIWREIVTTGRKELKEEEPDEMMTLEDFLAKAGAGEEEEDGEDHEMKMMPMLSFDSANAIQMLDKVEGSIVGFRNGGGGSGRGKRGRAPAMEQLDKAAQQRQKRMIKNRESAARSRERKQAYQVELESLAVKLEEEHEQLLKEREERAKERLKQIMENVVPVVEKRRPRRKLQRAPSWTW